MLHGDRLYFINVNDDPSYLLCLDRHNGKEVWRFFATKQQLTTPLIWQNDSARKLFSWAPTRLVFDLAGNLLWWLTGCRAHHRHAYADAACCTSAGLRRVPLRPLYAIARARRDISLGPDEPAMNHCCASDAAP